MVPLGPPRTKCVSVCKTKHSRAEVLISVTLRGGIRYGCTLNFSLDKTSTFCACSTPRWLQDGPFDTNRNVPNGPSGTSENDPNGGI